MPSKPVVRKVLAYVVHDGRLLVFRQPGDPGAGLQVPAGTVRTGEHVEEAVLREAREETGLEELRVRRFLGRDRVDVAPYREEIQDRFVFQLDPAAEPPERRTHHELHDGTAPPTPFDLFWLPLDDPELDELVVGHGALLHLVDRWPPGWSACGWAPPR